MKSGVWQRWDEQEGAGEEGGMLNAQYARPPLSIVTLAEERRGEGVEGCAWWKLWKPPLAAAADKVSNQGWLGHLARTLRAVIGLNFWPRT